MAGTVPTISITNPDMESENLALTAPNTPDSPTVFDIVKTIDHKDWETEAPLSLDDGNDVAKDLEVANGDDHIDSDESDDLQRIETIEYGRNSIESDEDPEPKAHATAAATKRTTLTQAIASDSRKLPENVSNDEDGPSFVALSQFYNEKSILITGVTGFIGKAVLWKLLKSLHEPIEKIYVLIRPSGTHRKSTSRPSDRLHQEVLSNKAFVNLRRTFGATAFDRLIREKVQVIVGDLNMPSLGLSDSDRAAIIKNVNVVIHCAASIDGKERLDTATMTNAIGTMRLMDLADECAHMKSFVHLSPATAPNDYSASSGSPVQERIYPLGLGDPETLLNQTLGMDVEEMTKMTQRVLQYFPNTYLYTKALAEHLLLKRAESKRVHEENGTREQYPIAIMRISSVGAAVSEPLVGWADSVAGPCGTILLIGKGMQPIQVSEGDNLLDIVPVDYAVRLILGCAASIKAPGTEFIPPYPEYIHSSTDQDTRPPSLAGSISNDSTRPPSSVASPSYQRSSTATSRSSRPVSQKFEPKDITYFPYIYNVSVQSLDPISCRDGYDIIREYWTRSTSVVIPTSQSYFSPPPNSGGLSRARTMMRTFTSMVGGVPANSVDALAGAPKRNSQRLSRIIEKASKLSEGTKGFARQSAVFLDQHVRELKLLLSQDANRGDYDLQDVIPDDAGPTFWKSYLLDASYGVHYYVGQETGLRNNNLPAGWDCAIRPRATLLYQGNTLHQLVIDRRIHSAIFSLAQVNQRVDRMVSHVEDAVTKPHHGQVRPKNPLEAEAMKKHDEEWLTDLDDALADWCEDVLTKDAPDGSTELGRWRVKIGDNDEAVKVLVLNDKRVGASLKQIVQNAGVPQQTGVNEAMKILLRMRERTQLSYVWFAGSFLKSLLGDMFESVRVREQDIAKVRQAIQGKRVVYVPVYKTVLDPLMVWYTVIRYQLPVPALACDEFMGGLGPLSDVFRLAGAFYIKRNAKSRSPLNSAVTAAYTQVLLREHGALSFVLEAARSRTGKPQASYPDGLVSMILEAALQHNQSRLSQYSVDSDTAPASPISPISPNADGLVGQKDVVFVPINITYEKIPELAMLVDEVLDQRPQSQAASLRLPMQGVTRPSEAMDKRQKTLEGSQATKGRYGRALVGFGDVISVQNMATEVNSTLKLPVFGALAEDEAMVQKITKNIQQNQRDALIISPVGLVSAIVLYGRATGGVHLGKIRDLLEWLCTEIKQRGLKLDWQDGQDLDAIIFNAFKILDEQRNLHIEGREVTDETNVRVNDHADNVMTLSYHANQIVDPFLCEAFFSVVYLSITAPTVAKEEIMDRFRFLVQMFEQEFVIKWDIDEKFASILDSFVAKGIIKIDSSKPSELILAVGLETDALQYERLIFLASLVYPTVDAYWITSCSLSALEAVPSLPRSIVPLLCQWIATHLISGRRTIYREVLSTEASRTAVDVFMALGFVSETQAKEKLSPDAQMLLHELGISTSETLIELNGQNSEGGATPVSPVDPEGMMRALMAQIQMNRANSNMADLCQQIDSYRLGAASQRESFQNAQVFNKCQKQIKGILRANSETSFAQRRGHQLIEQEEDMVQLVYALRLGSASNSTLDASGKSIRRVSEAYNLQKASTA